MGLSAVDISKIKRLSVKDVKVPKMETAPPSCQAEQPPTKEETAYSGAVRINPCLEQLIDDFDLVSVTTGKRLRTVTVNQPRQINESKLLSFARQLIEKEYGYSKEDILNRIKKTTNVSHERAETGFNLMLEAGILEQAANPNLYYLGGSTPF